ncbi:MAG: dicarboxylate/amino acid:cation symporter [Sphingomonadaceae bacterium]|uniref:dicarboxylate/amino acid:cation symporter n=1 Tax=Thermaurantiacus sp. TaxID=2820283 RepID=UPI00298F1584|nr:dicarboxylate/amino acid:cation symporter [Thermaurantiacus sp.]MCS6987211.1 dicarboxylate/amino acid:cation symporter [Sphingomonadaceae bacterium]MDW8414431.1 dicarboxylate/amino acid:cation symporter [Thermaurantiacus sp.]
MRLGLTAWILVALVAGLAAGAFVNLTQPPADAARFADALSLITDIFLRLIKMIIAPLVLGALVAGIGRMGGDVAALSRIGGRAVAWFIATSVGALAIGWATVTGFRPGDGLGLPLPPTSADAGISTEALTFRRFMTELVPTSVVDALARNQILQVVVFSVFAGVALARLGDKGRVLREGAEALMDLMLVVTGFVMKTAPLAVFAAVAATIAQRGLGVVATYGKFMGGFYVALLGLIALNLLALAVVIGAPAVGRLLREIRDPFVLAFSTASSEAAYPRMLAALDRFGIPGRISAFVLPLGYSFNLDGSMMYCVFACLFIAQAYGIELSLFEQLAMMAMLLVTSKGIAGVPRASLVVIAATLPVFGLPTAGLLLILGVDHFLDMGRSATNAVGNAVASAAVAHWELAREATPRATAE